MIISVLKRQSIVVQKIIMAQIVRNVQDTQITSAIIMANVKGLAQEKEMEAASAKKDILETSVQIVLQDIMNLTKMKKLCYVLYAMQRVMDLAEVLVQRIVRNVLLDGT